MDNKNTTLELRNNINNVEIIVGSLNSHLLKILSRSHVVDVMLALNTSSKDGLSHKDLQYEVVRGPGLDQIIRPMIEVGIIVRNNEKYHITKMGKEALGYVNSILEIERRYNKRVDEQ